MTREELLQTHPEVTLLDAADLGGLEYNVPSGDFHNFNVAGASEMFLSSTSLDLQGNIIKDFTKLEFTESSDHEPTYCHGCPQRRRDFIHKWCGSRFETRNAPRSSIIALWSSLSFTHET